MLGAFDVLHGCFKVAVFEFATDTATIVLYCDIDFRADAEERSKHDFALIAPKVNKSDRKSVV